MRSMDTNDHTEPRDRRFFWVTVFVAMALAALPVVFGWALTPRGYEWYGTHAVSPGDPSVYYSYIAQGRSGRLLMFDALTGEAHQPTIFQPWWWLIGQVANLFRLSTPIIFVLSRLALIPLLLAAVWSAARWVFHGLTARRIAFLLATFSGGLGGIVTLIVRHGEFRFTLFPDLWVSEAYTMLTTLSNSHFLLVTAGLLYTLVAVERSWQTGRWRPTFLAGLVALGVLFIHPFHVLTWLMVWVGLTAGRWIRRRRFPAAYVVRWLTVVLLASPAIIYYGWQLTTDPLAAIRAEQNINLTLPWWRMLVGFGLLLPGAVIGLIRWRPRDERWEWLVVLNLAYWVAIYLPLDFQRRLSQGMVVPLALAAVPAATPLWGRLRRRAAGLRVSVVAAAALILSSSWLIAAGFIMVRYYRELTAAPLYQFYLTPETRDLIQYIRAATPTDQPILATMSNSSVIAGLTAHHVYVAHTVETLHFHQKFEAMRTFYQSADRQEQAETIRRGRICYILDGPRERAYGQAFQPSAWPEVTRVWSGPTTALYKMNSCP